MYGQHTWVVFDMTGKEVSRARASNSSKKRFSDDRPILTMKMETLENFSIVYWSGDDTAAADDDMSIETFKAGVKGSASLSFCSVFALNRRQTKIWVCRDEVGERNEQDNGGGGKKKKACGVIMYVHGDDGKWARSDELPEKKFPLLMLELSQDEVRIA